MTALVLGSADFMDCLQAAIGSRDVHLVSAPSGPLLDRSLALYEPDVIIIEAGRPSGHRGILRSLLTASKSLSMLAVVGPAVLDLASSDTVVSLQHSNPIELLVFVLSNATAASA